LAYTDLAVCGIAFHLHPFAKGLRGRVFGPGLSRVSGERKFAVSIIRTRLAFEVGYTRIPNTWMRDPRLSRRSRGLLAELMTHRVGWEITIESLAAGGPEGKDAIRTSLKELEAAGYLIRRRERAEDGTLRGTQYELSDPFEGRIEPTSDNPPLDDSPTADQPTLDSPTLGNPTQRRPSSKEDQEKEPVFATLTPGGAPTLFAVDSEEAPENGIAKRAHDNTKGALPYMGMRTIAKWAIHTRGTDPGTVEKAIADLYKSGRAVTKQSVGQMLDGYAKTRQAPKTTKEVFAAGAEQAARFKAMEEAEQHRLQLGTGK
jgi:hypothetical protein